MTWRLLVLLFAAQSLACSGSASRGDRRRVAIQGSDTMVILAQHWAEAYADANRGVLVEVNGGGSGTGFTALINGVTDIANASRPIKASEVRALIERRSARAVETRVALDAIAIYVHENNPVESLTLAQLAQLYRGQVRNWREVGGADRPVTLYGRENSSGTYAYFKEHVLDDRDFAVEAQSLPGTAGVIQAVSVDPGGIGYGGIGYASRVRRLPLRWRGGTVEPTIQAARTRAYPLARYLYMYTAGEPAGGTRDFVEWVLSPAGQRLVERAGYYPLGAEG